MKSQCNAAVIFLKPIIQDNMLDILQTIFWKCLVGNESFFFTLINTSLKFIPNVPIDDKSVLV